MLGHHDVFLGVIKTAAMYSPKLAVNTFGNQIRRFGFKQIAIEQYKVKRGADPSDSGDDMNPPQQ